MKKRHKMTTTMTSNSTTAFASLSNADIDELREKYRNYLFTENGKMDLKDALRLKREWKEIQLQQNSAYVFNTNNVNISFINANLRNKITLIKIIPIGVNNLCHTTSKLFCDDRKSITRRLGFNITACPCGKKMCFELHSVNKCGNTLYDFTRDFNDESEKYFLEMSTNMTANEFVMFCSPNIFIDNGCRCKNVNIRKELMKRESELINIVERASSVIVIR